MIMTNACQLRNKLVFTMRIIDTVNKVNTEL